MQGNSKGISIAALICGIFGVLSWALCSVPLISWILFVAAILGIVFGAVGMSKSKAENGKASGLAIAGLVLGIIGAFFGLVGVICSCSVCVVAGPMGCMNPDYAALINAATKYTLSL